MPARSLPSVTAVTLTRPTAPMFETVIHTTDRKLATETRFDVSCPASPQGRLGVQRRADHVEALVRRLAR